MNKSSQPKKEKIDYSLKLLLLGDSTVGKTSLYLRYFEDYYQDSQLQTIGVDYRIKKVDYLDRKINLNIWDTAGQDRFRAITQSYYKGAHGVLLLFDVTNINTFQNVKQWLSQIKEYSPNNCELILAGNKIDIKERSVSKEEATALAEEYKIQYIEISAKENINVKEVFASLYSCIIDKLLINKDDEVETKKKSGKKLSRSIDDPDVSGSKCC